MVTVPSGKLLRTAERLTHGRLAKVLQLEVLPNRDSLPYGKLYGIDETAADVSLDDGCDSDELITGCSNGGPNPGMILFVQEAMQTCAW